jgi:hypothetical protein
MKTVVSGLILVCLAAVAGAADVPAPAGILEVAERVYDAGKIDRGTTLRHSFLLKNVGTAELSIDAKPG